MTLNISGSSLRTQEASTSAPVGCPSHEAVASGLERIDHLDPAASIEAEDYDLESHESCLDSENQFEVSKNCSNFEKGLTINEPPDNQEVDGALPLVRTLNSVINLLYHMFISLNIL